jgi:RimJ/RimL family protein N-acetyltransferase
MDVQVRPATEADSRAVFGWRNEPLSIEASRSRTGVEWEGHSKWFPAQLSKDDTTCLIGEYQGEPCGVVWFRKGRCGIYETSINLDAKFRGKKISEPVLAGALKWMRRNKGALKFSTEIRDDNIPSIKMFEGCGFIYVHPSPGFGTYCT